MIDLLHPGTVFLCKEADVLRDGRFRLLGKYNLNLEGNAFSFGSRVPQDGVVACDVVPCSAEGVA